MLFLAYFPYYFLVCLVDFRHINGVQIHLRCLYGVMPHALADYWNGYVHVSCYACPCMPCGICGEWHFQPCHFTYLLQIIVDVLQHTMILFLFGSVILLNNRKKITRVRDNILKSKEQKTIQPTKGGHKMVTCQNYVSLFYCQITSCPSDGGIS